MWPKNQLQYEMIFRQLPIQFYHNLLNVFWDSQLVGVLIEQSRCPRRCFGRRSVDTSFSVSERFSFYSGHLHHLFTWMTPSGCCQKSLAFKTITLIHSLKFPPWIYSDAFWQKRRFQTLLLVRLIRHMDEVEILPPGIFISSAVFFTLFTSAEVYFIKVALSSSTLDQSFSISLRFWNPPPQ